MCFHGIFTERLPAVHIWSLRPGETAAAIGPGSPMPPGSFPCERSPMSRRLRLLGASAIVAGVAGAAIPATASAVPVITMSGSTSVAPLASLLAKAYLKQYPGRVKFKLAQGGSDVGVADVA